VILDVYSRYVVGSPGVIAERESAELVAQLLLVAAPRLRVEWGAHVSPHVYHNVLAHGL